MRASGVRDVLIYCIAAITVAATRPRSALTTLARSCPAVGRRAGFRLHRLRQTWCGSAAEVSSRRVSHNVGPGMTSPIIVAVVSEDGRQGTTPSPLNLPHRLARR